VPEGTVLTVQTTTTLSTKSKVTGDRFRATLAQPLLFENREIASEGAEVTGQIIEADPGGRVKGVATLTVTLIGLAVNGKSVDIATHSVTQSADASKRKDAAEVAAGAAVGAVIGAIAGGGKGAAIGTAAGGGAGAGVVLATRGEAALIPAESMLTFRLSQPLSVAGK
jgi:hypothetical protein